MPQKRISEMHGEKSDNDFRAMFQCGTMALPNHPLERTGDSVGFFHSWLSRLSPAAHRQR
jgi:hypothetical protein